MIDSGCLVKQTELSETFYFTINNNANNKPHNVYRKETFKISLFDESNSAPKK